MNANDNFEKKDLNESNVNPTPHSVTNSSAEQNNEEPQKEQNLEPKSSKESDVEEAPKMTSENQGEKTSTAETETKEDDAPLAEIKEESAIAEDAKAIEEKDKAEAQEAKETSAESEEEKEEKTPTAETETKEGDAPLAETKEDSATAEDADDSDKKATDKADTQKAEKPPVESKEEEKEKSEVKTKEESKTASKKPTLKATFTFAEIIARLRELADKDRFSRKELDKFQNLFFAEIRKEAEEQKEQFISEGGKEEDFVIKESELHTEGKNLLQTLTEKRKKHAAEEEKLKIKNMERKLAIIEEVRVLTESPEDFNKKYQEFKSLQHEWRELKLVPHGKDHALWRKFQEEVEKFYDIVHLHNEYRDYDFKKNLESKIGLCEAAEKLTVEKDIVSAFHQLQKLHNDWRDIGPVARKDREIIWERFKEASAEINRRYQTRIESRKAQESENYEKKIAICETLEAIDISSLKDTRDWESKTREVLNLQGEWRQIGYAPRKVNAKIFRRYRAACDLFFKGKNEYYQSIRGELEENLKKKIELCERAEAMKDSQDWKNTTSDMIAIQREWKEIGMVPRRSSSSVWKRFISACDYFFEQKKLHTKAIRQEEQENLKKKKEVCEKIRNIDPKLSNEEALETLKELMSEWQSIGFVPFKDISSSRKEFIEATDSIYSRLNIDKSERKLETFKSNISEMTKSDRSRGKVFHEREKLMRQFDRMKSDLQTYENNIGFLTSSSKKGSVVLDDMNSKIEKIKAELDLIVKKIEAIDENV